MPAEHDLFAEEQSMVSMSFGDHIEELRTRLILALLGLAVGVVLTFVPPLNLGMHKVAPALATGNTVVLKPSVRTPLTALAFGELLAEIFPPGVVNVVSGSGEAIGDSLVVEWRARHEQALPSRQTRHFHTVCSSCGKVALSHA